jgi:molybdopterin-binding protein
VSAVRAEGRLLLIELDAGLPLMAAVTRASAMELGLEPGSSIHALIKASAIHLLPRREG